MTKDIYNGIIDSYTIEKYKSGIIHLMIVTNEKYEDYHRYNDNYYLITHTCTPEKEYTIVELHIPKEELTIPSNYICTHTREKDQIHYFWTPVELCTNNEKVISKLKEKRENELTRTN